MALGEKATVAQRVKDELHILDLTASARVGLGMVNGLASEEKDHDEISI